MITILDIISIIITIISVMTVSSSSSSSCQSLLSIHRHGRCFAGSLAPASAPLRRSRRRSFRHFVRTQTEHLHNTRTRVQVRKLTRSITRLIVKNVNDQNV